MKFQKKYFIIFFSEIPLSQGEWSERLLCSFKANDSNTAEEMLRIKDKIKSGKFVILAEFEPPKGADFSIFLNNANLVRGRIDAFLIPEMAIAVMKASSLGGCAFLQHNGFETIFQACCRDRNRLALQADILSAGALGIPNIRAVSGDDIKQGGFTGTIGSDNPNYTATRQVK